MTVLRPDATPGTFDIVSVDNGITDVTSPGTVEAVRHRLFLSCEYV